MVLHSSTFSRYKNFNWGGKKLCRISRGIQETSHLETWQDLDKTESFELILFYKVISFSCLIHELLKCTDPYKLLLNSLLWSTKSSQISFPRNLIKLSELEQGVRLSNFHRSLLSQSISRFWLFHIVQPMLFIQGHWGVSTLSRVITGFWYCPLVGQSSPYTQPCWLWNLNNGCSKSWLKHAIKY